MKRILLLVLVILLVALGAVGIASAADPEVVVPTTGEVPAGATAPVVQNAFMLPDMNAADNGAVINLIPPYEDAPGGGPVNVTPSLYNTPQRFMGFWALLTSAGGIGSINDAWVNVYHPDGTFKYQLHMEKVTCASLGTPTTVGSPAAGAVMTGQKSDTDFTAIPTGIIDQCLQGLLQPYFISGEITKDQPYGIYSYTIGATALGGGSVTSAPYTFEVLPIAGLAKDFSQVDFGQINPQSMKITDGDATWGGVLPTVASIGNVWLNLIVNYDPMIGLDPAYANYNKVIDVFDLVVGAPSGNPLGQASVSTGPINAMADTPTSFILPPNCPVKIQFSAHPEIMGLIRTATNQTGVPSGIYTGDVELVGVASASQWTSGWEAALDLCRFDIPPSQ